MEGRAKVTRDILCEEARFILANVLAERGSFLEAMDEYLTALRLEPQSPTAHYNLASFLAAHGHDMAIAEYKAAIDLEYMAGDKACLV